MYKRQPKVNVVLVMEQSLKTRNNTVVILVLLYVGLMLKPIGSFLTEKISHNVNKRAMYNV